MAALLYRESPFGSILAPPTPASLIPFSDNERIGAPCRP